MQLYPREWARGAWDRAWRCVTWSDGAEIAHGCVERVGMSLEKAGPLHALPLFTDPSVLPLTFFYYQTISNLMRDVHNNKVPSGILNLQWNLYQALGECFSVRLIQGVRLTQVSIDDVIWGVKCHSNGQWKRLEYSQRLWRYTFALISLSKWTNWS